MRFDPFLIKEEGGDIKDRRVKDGAVWIDGDIVAAPSYRKHPRYQWQKFRHNRALFYISLLLFAVLLGKLYYLQIVRGAEYYRAAEDNRLQITAWPAPRGVIFDRQGVRLAYNVPDFALSVVPALLPAAQEEEDKIFFELARIVDRTPFDLVESFARVPRSSRESAEIMRGLTQEQAIQIENQTPNWPGIMIQAVEQRAYEPALPLAPVLGYTGKIAAEEFPELREQNYALNDLVGKTGIEKVYERALRGQAGQKFIEVNSRGKTKGVLKAESPIAGANLYLNLDAELQTLAWQELSNMIRVRQAKGGSVIALDPRSGAVLSLVSYPSFDNNLFARGIDPANYQTLLADPDKPLYNRAVLGEYPSGSTFKMIVAAAALEEKLIAPNFTVLSSGGFWISNYHFPDWKAGGHGRTDVVKALAESVNTFFYTIGGGVGDFAGLGLEKIVAWGRRFGLTAPTGIDLPAEAAGFLPSQEWKIKTKGERWFLGDTYHLSIGQGDILVTPLQVANYTAAIGNGGALYAPQLLKKIVGAGGETREFAPRLIREGIASESTLSLIKAGLRAAVTSGSVRSLAALSVPAAGKTGTAESGGEAKPHAWFTGFAPYEEPELVVTVLVEEGGGGERSATPIAKKIFEQYFSKRRESTNTRK